MKILHIFNELKYSGAEIMYVDAANEFKNLGCELYAVNTTKELGVFSSAFEREGFKVLHLPYPKNIFSRWKYYKRMISLIKREKIDIIHIHRNDMKWGMALVSKIVGIKSVYTVHNCFYNPPITKPYQIWLRWSSRFLFGCKFQSISDSVELNELQFYHNKTTKIYNWFGNQRFFPARYGEKEEIRKMLDLPPDATVIISVGGCSPVKRHTDIIKVLPDLLKNDPKLVYLHLGEGTSLNEEQELANKLGISKSIRFLGNQDNVRQFLIASDYYLMPSKFEGIPITAIEALACKIPAILYDVPGLRDFNSEMKCALIIPEDAKKIVDAINNLKDNPNLRQEISENGYNYVLNKYFLPRNIRKIFSLYN